MSTHLSTENKDHSQTRRQEYIRPHYEVRKGDAAYEVDVYLPGVPSKQANVTLEKNTLHVTGHRASHAQENWRTTHRELPTADYRLQLELNMQVDEDKIKAGSKNGILTITLPVAEEAKPRTIEIK